MDPILAALDRRCSSTGKARVLAAVLLVLAVALAVAGLATASMQPAEITFGALSGALLFLAGYTVIAHCLPMSLSARLDFRNRMALPRRRWMALWIFLAWVALLLVAGRYVGSGVVLGALNVAVLLGIWRLGTMTEDERVFSELEVSDDDDTVWTADTELDEFPEGSPTDR